MSADEPYVCTLSPELVQKAQDELNEKAEWRLRDIQALRDMVNAHPGLKTRMDDGFLLRFLRARKFDYDRAYQMLLNYYQIRAENEMIFHDFRPSALKHLLDRHVTVVLPNRDPEGRKLVYFRPGKWDPSECPIYDVLRLNMMVFEKMIQEEETQVNGIMMVGDFSDMGMNHAKNFDRNYAKLMSSVIQECYPIRMKGANITNEPAVFGYVFSIIKPFLKEKLRERMHFHGSNLDSLQKNVPKSCLPSEVGGTLGSIEDLAEAWNKELLADEAKYIEMEQYHLEIPKQIMKKKNEEIVDCLIGTYRKLNVD